MNERQRRFADEYIISGNATDAAIKAGYSEKTARSQGQRLLTKVDISIYSKNNSFSTVARQSSKPHNNL